MLNYIFSWQEWIGGYLCLKVRAAFLLHDPCLECAPLVLSITLNGRTKRVSRYDAATSACGVTPPGATPSPGAILSELGHKIDTTVNLDKWLYPWPRSEADVRVTVFTDDNGDGKPQESEVLGGVPVQLIPPDRTVLSVITNPFGLAEFDLTGYPAGIVVKATAPSIGQSYCFYLPSDGRTLPSDSVLPISEQARWEGKACTGSVPS